MKNSFKKLTALLLSAIMIILVLPAGMTAFAEEETANDISEFTYTADGSKITITGINDRNVTRLVIPYNVSVGGVNYTVVSLAEQAFYGLTELEYVHVLPGIQKIESKAFADCAKLEKAHLGISVMSIAGDAFDGCHQLKEFYVDNSFAKGRNVLSTGKRYYYSDPYGSLYYSQKNRPTAFYWDGDRYALSKSLFHSGRSSNMELVRCPESFPHERYDIPYDVLYIGSGAFSGCKNIKYVSCSTSLKEIGDHAFIGCDNLKYIEIPAMLKSIGESAFESDTVILCYDGSYAMNYAIENGYSYLLIDKLITLPDESNLDVDFESKTIAGFTNGLSTVDDISVNGDFSVSTDEQTQRVYTGMPVKICDEDQVVLGLTSVVFGDTTGDGWYDGQDAFFVRCIAQGMIEPEDIGEAKYKAADCNHDGTVNMQDVEILEKAGLMLAKIDQSKSEEELLLTD